MGFFSFITSDTDKQVVTEGCPIPPTKVYVITEDGRSWKEESYEGYGEFGDKDIYVLIAELNGYTPDKAPKKTMFGDDKEQKMREFAINLVHNNGVTNGKVTYKMGEDFTDWEQKIHEGKSANQLIKEGWKDTEYKDWDEAAKHGIKLPKIVEKLPSKENWKAAWDSLPYPKRDPNQGYPEGCLEGDEED